MHCFDPSSITGILGSMRFILIVNEFFLGLGDLFFVLGGPDIFQDDAVLAKMRIIERGWPEQEGMTLNLD